MIDYRLTTYWKMCQALRGPTPATAKIYFKVVPTLADTKNDKLMQKALRYVRFK